MVKPLTRLSDSDFFNLMAVAPPFEMVIKSAIIIESEIEELFNRAFLDVKRIHKMELRYEQKIELALALGVDGRFGAPLRNLAKVRNVFAHQADAEFSLTHANDLYFALDKIDRRLVNENYSLMQSKRGVAFDALPPEEKFVLVVVTVRAAIKVAQLQTSQLLKPNSPNPPE
ncbi:hypothetical protein E0H66_23020 [Rhizobium leguminosarum bv. viciae]|nr:hypothetical protein E0H66_23020 [Rhizobium leguminosarum bv. viciae]